MSVRDWFRRNYPGSSKAAQWVDLWGAATAVDLRLQQSEEAAGWAGVQETLATDDLVEIHLRRLSSCVYGSRTGDWGSANFMLAVQPPDSERDIGPSWLTTGATAHSKSEFQRSEQVAKTSKPDEPPKGKGQGKEGAGEGANRPQE